MSYDPHGGKKTILALIALFLFLMLLASILGPRSGCSPIMASWGGC